MEFAARHAQVEAGEVKPFDSPVSIHVRSWRVRLVDVDNLSGKAIIDGIVACGLLRDDSPKYVTQVTYDQQKVGSQADEKTVVTITEVVDG